MFEQLRLFIYDRVSSAVLCESMLLLIMAAMAVTSYYMASAIMLWIEKIVEKSDTKLDDIILDRPLCKAVARLVPALVVNHCLPQLIDTGSSLHQWIKVLTALYVLVAVIYLSITLVKNLYNLMEVKPSTKKYAVKGIFQMLRLIIICIGVIVGLSIILGREPATIVTAIGASAAVLMLVFKDTILGLVASVQLSANRMLKKGDWIVCESHGVNGTVTDVSLTTVKVLNWDNSISTIPPYTLITDSFRNYQAMRDAGGRRVERSILIDMNTVRFLDRDELCRLRNRGRLSGIDLDGAAEMVNLHLLRLYLDNFISRDKRVNASMLYMVRQLQPTDRGLPLQMYFFTKATAWREYEQVQSDIFDHIYAIVNEFGLRIFQAPAGTDILRIKT